MVCAGSLAGQSFLTMNFLLLQLNNDINIIIAFLYLSSPQNENDYTVISDVNQ